MEKKTEKTEKAEMIETKAEAKPKKEKPARAVFQPKESCNDNHCPFHGGISVHGRTFTGRVIKEVFHKTATIEFPRLFFIPKYDRYEKRRTTIRVHVPPCINVRKGSVIKIGETRPISKTKNFVVVEMLKE